MTVIRDCAYPGCREGKDGNPALTTLGCCILCTAKVRRLLNDVVLDYVNLKRNLPRPVAKSKSGRGTPTKAGYGHPAEWASDTARDIRTVLFWHVDHLAEHLGLPTSEPRPGADETAVVAAAHGFLAANLAALIRSPLLELVVTELTDLHTVVRNGMGYTRMGERLAAPCPKCDVAALIRRPPGRPQRGTIPADAPPIRCANCGHEIGEYREVVAARVETASAARAAAIDAALARHGQYPQGPDCRAHVADVAACLAAKHC